MPLKDGFCAKLRCIQIPMGGNKYAYVFQRAEKNANLQYHLDEDGTQSAVRVEGPFEELFV